MVIYNEKTFNKKNKGAIIMKRKVLLVLAICFLVFLINACSGSSSSSDKSSSSSSGTTTGGGSSSGGSGGNSGGSTGGGTSGSGSSGGNSSGVDYTDNNSFTPVAIANPERKPKGLWLGKMTGTKDGQPFEENVIMVFYMEVDIALDNNTNIIGWYSLRTSFGEYRGYVDFDDYFANGNHTFGGNKFLEIEGYKPSDNDSSYFPCYDEDRYYVSAKHVINEERNHLHISIKPAAPYDDLYQDGVRVVGQPPFSLEAEADLYLKWYDFDLSDYPLYEKGVKINFQTISKSLESINKTSKSNILGVINDDNEMLVFKYDESINAIVLNDETLINNTTGRPVNFKVFKKNDDIFISYFIGGKQIVQNKNSGWSVFQ